MSDSSNHEPLPVLDVDVDLSQDVFKDLPAATAVDPLETTYAVPHCFTHPEQDDCGCQGFNGQWDLPTTVANDDQLLSLDEPDYSKFENWIPRFVRPERPCDYCRSRRLQCYLQRDEASCTACNSLFRECSLTNSHTLEACNYLDGTNGLFLDTLHVVDENAVKDHGSLTGIKPLASKGRASGTSTPSKGGDDAPGSTKRNGIRFPRHAIKTLRDWLDAHPSHPYPTEEEKTELERQTELKPIQIANWLANARRRRKASDKPRPRIMQSPSLKPSTPAITIPQADKPWDELNPFERWKHSPPENEPALMTDIVHAVVNSDLPQDQPSQSPSSKASRRDPRSSNGSGLSNYRANSTTSGDTSKRSSSMTASTAAFSHGSSNSFGSFGSFGSGLGGKKDRRRRKRPLSTNIRRPSDDSKKRPFQCTFCTDTFKSKYDWTRHEKSLHLSLEKWICAPIGPVVVDPTTGKTICVYCNAVEPSQEHTESHNHRQCEEKGLDARTFYRKDHLRQHLRLMHGCELLPHMDAWRAMLVHVNSRCGFCSQRFTVWQERVDHLTAHYKAGARMSEWKGCRGLDPNVAAQVTNAMPPYLIGIESVSPVPFSATNRSNCRLISATDGPSVREEGTSLGELLDHDTHPEWTSISNGKATCWEVLTVRLAKFVTDQVKQGIIVTDEMLQQHARRILYDSDDPWNQTAADNPEWLDLFKKAHGLDLIPNNVGGQGSHVPDDLEWYGDLGLRIPFVVQLAALNKEQARETDTGVADESQHENPLAKQRACLKELHSRLAPGGFLRDELSDCGHSECRENVLDMTFIRRHDSPGPRYRRWCSENVPFGDAEVITRLQATAKKLAINDQHGLNASGLVWLVPSSSTARAQGLSTLARIEAPLRDDGLATKSPRHKCQLSPQVARRFATITGAWEDSGAMPEPYSTRAFDVPVQDTSTTTGAMMEFLGGDVGDALSFGADTATSMLELDPAMDVGEQTTWLNDTEAIPMSNEAMLKSLDELLAADRGTIAPKMSPTTVSPETNLFAVPDWQVHADAQDVMAGVDFSDINFDDGVFEMQLDDAVQD